jgi:hypothetical protein
MTQIAPTTPTSSWLALEPVSPSVPPSLSERLIRALEAHASAEAHDLATCEEMAARTRDPVMKMLMGLVVEDAQRHHTLLHSMVRQLQEEVDFVAGIPDESASEQSTATAPELAVTLRELIRDEHEGARHLRHIARQEPRLHDGLYPLLLETIARDSEKHATILRYLLGRVESKKDA